MHRRRRCRRQGRGKEGGGHIIVVEPQRRRCGEEMWGRAGGEAVSSLSFWLLNGLGKDPGERGATIDDDVIRSFIPLSSTSVMRWLMAASKDFISFCKSAEN